MSAAVENAAQSCRFQRARNAAIVGKYGFLPGLDGRRQPNMPDSNIKEDALTKPGPLDAVTNRQLLAAIRKARRNTYGDPMYHSGRKKKEFASPYLEFLAMPEKATRKMPQPTSSTPGTQTGSGTRIWTQGNGS